MMSNSLLRKLEQVIKAYILREDDPSPANVYTSIDAVAGDVLKVPYVAVICPRSRPYTDMLDAVSGIANRVCECEITIRTDVAHGDVTTAVEAHDELAGRVLTLFYRPDIVTLLNGQNVDGLAIDQVDLPVEVVTPVNMGLETRLSFEVLCHPEITEA